MRRRLWLARGLTLFAGSGLIAASVLTGPAAQAVTYYQIVNNGSGKCIDISNGSIGTVAIQEPCNSGNPFEFWALVSVCTQFGCSDQYLIKNLDTSLCLAPNSSSVPTPVAQYRCDTSGNNINQVWERIPSSGSPFKLANDNDCAEMHPSSNSNSNGVRIFVQFNTSDSHYLWHFGASV